MKLSGSNPTIPISTQSKELVQPRLYSIRYKSLQIDSLLMAGLHPLLKGCAIAGYISIALVNLIEYLSPSQGYELSIYSATPFVAWLLIIICVICGIIILIWSVIQSTYHRLSSWILGLILLLFTRLTILYLPYNRGYFSWTGDNISHAGLVIDILRSGFFSGENFYPITHIILSQIQIISDINTYLVINYSTAIISVFFVLSFYLLGNIIFSDRRYTLLTLASVGCVIFNQYDVFLTPNGWSILFFPFIFFVVLKTMKKKDTLAYSVLAIILLTMLPFFHPLSTLMMIAILTMFLLIFIFINNFHALRKVLDGYIRVNTDLNPLPFILILLAVWIPWVISFSFFNANIEGIFDALVSGDSVNVIAGMSGKLGKMGFGILDTLLLILMQMGSELFFLALFLLGTFIVMTKCRQKPDFENFFVLMIITLMFGSLYTLYIFNLLPGVENIGAERLLAYLVLFLPLFAGVVYTQLLIKNPRVYSGICIILILIPVVLSILSLYSSPIISYASPQISVMDMEGAQWAIDMNQDKVAFVMIAKDPSRFADGLMGTVAANQRVDLKDIKNVPDHFTYADNRWLGQAYSGDRFLLMTKMDKILYSTIYKRIGRFGDADFSRLRSDMSVDWLYSNGESEVVNIHGNYIYLK
jgi:hypothetical protein